MNRLIGVIVLLFFALIGAGVFLTWIARSRVDQGRLYCMNNLRVMAQFAAMHESPPKNADAATVPNIIPPGTVPNPAFTPEQRLAWTVPALLTFDQRIQDTAAIFQTIQLDRAWDAEGNRPVAKIHVVTLTCPGHRPNPDTNGDYPTQYVGMAGIGDAAATLRLGPPVPPEAGCWRYDGPTPFTAITDGLSSTLLFAETDTRLGPWSAGGTGTLRSLRVTADAPTVIGVGGQFGGNHPGGGNFAYADGSVHWLQTGIDSGVFRGLVTIAGGQTDPIPGE
jgi:prepilin-type processing-associated H-X9-DG protein